MGNLLQDVRFALRMLRRNPGFAIVAVVVLAVGIGANAAIFSVVDSVLIRPLPYPNPDRLVIVEGVAEGLGAVPLSYPAFLSWRGQTDTFEQVATYFNSDDALTGLGEPEQIRTLRASSNLLSILGAEPVLGRGFLPEEEARHQAPVAILTHSFWKNRFHSDGSVIGQKLTLSDRVYTIVGVLPESFQFGNHPAVLVPLALDTQNAPEDLNFLPVIGKLRPGLTITQARTALKVALPRVQKTATHAAGVTITPLQDALVGRSRSLLLVLLGAVGLVLLIACFNIANLLLARAASREKEIAIRVSLGARRTRLVRQMLTESSVLAVAGGVLGLALAWGGLGLLTTLLADRLPRNAQIHMNPAALAFTAVLSLCTGILFGLAPSLQAARGSLQERLKQGGWQAASASGSQRLRSVLVVAEIAFSLSLLAGAGLLVRSFAHLMNVEKGFDPDHVLTMAIDPSPGRYADPRTEINYLQEIVEGVQAIPGVRVAGFVTNLPLSGGSTNGGITIEGRPVDPKSPLIADKQFVTSDYLAAMRIQLLKGRYFNGADNTDSPKVVIIDQSFARNFFAGQDPIGKRIDVAWGDAGWSEVVGVVGDAKLEGLETSARPTLYAPIAQKPEILRFLGFALVVRTSVEPMSAAQAISHQIHQIDAKQALAAMRTMDKVLDQSLAPHRAPLWLFVIFASVALFLAAIGIYGVLAYFVVQRRQEIGVRMALGAQRGDILRLVSREGAKLVAIGLALGLVAALITSRALTSLLFGVKPDDLPTFVGISLLLALLAMVACAVPALRATRVDPLVVLRNE